MLQHILFFESVCEAGAGLRTIERVETTDDIGRIDIHVLDFLPGGEGQPWVVTVRHSEDFVHPLFGDRYPCIELSLAVMTIDPALPEYLSLVSASAAPCLDHQRFCFGAGVTWNPDTGLLAIYAQLRVGEKPRTVLVAELRERLRAVIALVYLMSFRIWQLQLRRRVPEDTSDPVVADTWQRMLELLDATPPAR